MTKKVKGVFCDPESFVWPEYKTERERIKAYSRKYRNDSIADAFAKHYNVDVSNMPEMVNFVPQELRVGSMFTTKILSIEKDKVVFDAANCKSNLHSAVNLYKYEMFKHFTPKDEVTAVVTRVDKDKVVIDPISPMVDDYLKPILNNPGSQKVIPWLNGRSISPIVVKDLKLSRGGFLGKAVIPNVSKFVGEDYTIDAFIPGSQIVLNIAEDFEQFNGASVEAFIVNYIPKPGTKSGMSLVCSAKELLKFHGELNMIEAFKEWCEETERWKNIEAAAFDGKVTGVINSSKKCGVFVEIPKLNITGMVGAKPEELVDYKPHQWVKVKLTGFDEETYFNQDVQQTQHAMPYEVDGDVLVKCNLKPILKFA